MAGNKRKGKGTEVSKKKKKARAQESERGPGDAQGQIETADTVDTEVSLRRSGRRQQRTEKQARAQTPPRGNGQRVRGGSVRRPGSRSTARESSRRKRVVVVQQQEEEEEEEEASESDALTGLIHRAGTPPLPADLLLDFRRLSSKKVKKFRMVEESHWFPGFRQSLTDPRFQTRIQESFYNTYIRARSPIAEHKMLDWHLLRKAAGGVPIRPYFTYIRGLEALVTDHRLWVMDWVRVFFATLYIDRPRAFVSFMFKEQVWRLTRETIAERLGLELEGTSLHDVTYGEEVDPPRRPRSTIFPKHEQIAPLFREPFLPGSPRTPDKLTDEAYTVHMALRRSLLPRRGNAETITALQQWLLLHIMTKQKFDVVDLIICEWEDTIFDGMSAQRQQPYAHLICYLLSELEKGGSRNELHSAHGQFGTYFPTKPNDKRRRPRAMILADDRLQRLAIAEATMTEVERERDKLALAECRLPSYFDTDTEDSDEDSEYEPCIPEPCTHDHEAGPSSDKLAHDLAPVSTSPPRVNETQPDCSVRDFLKEMMADHRRATEAALARQNEAHHLLMQEMRDNQRQVSDSLKSQQNMILNMFTALSGRMGHFDQRSGIEPPPTMSQQLIQYHHLPTPLPPSGGFLLNELPPTMSQQLLQYHHLPTPPPPSEGFQHEPPPRPTPQHIQYRPITSLPAPAGGFLHTPVLASMTAPVETGGVFDPEPMSEEQRHSLVADQIIQSVTKDIAQGTPSTAFRHPPRDEQSHEADSAARAVTEDIGQEKGLDSGESERKTQLEGAGRGPRAREEAKNDVEQETLQSVCNPDHPKEMTVSHAAAAIEQETKIEGDSRPEAKEIEQKEALDSGEMAGSHAASPTVHVSAPPIVNPVDQPDTTLVTISKQIQLQVQLELGVGTCSSEVGPTVSIPTADTPGDPVPPKGSPIASGFSEGSSSSSNDKPANYMLVTRQR